MLSLADIKCPHDMDRQIGRESLQATKLTSVDSDGRKEEKKRRIDEPGWQQSCQTQFENAVGGKTLFSK